MNNIFLGYEPRKVGPKLDLGPRSPVLIRSNFFTIFWGKNLEKNKIILFLPFLFCSKKIFSTFY